MASLPRPQAGPRGTCVATCMVLFASVASLVVPGDAGASGLGPRVLGRSFDLPRAMVVDGPDVFVADAGDNPVGDVDATTGALVRDLAERP
jgi:hypothetical protein